VKGLRRKEKFRKKRLKLLRIMIKKSKGLTTLGRKLRRSHNTCKRSPSRRLLKLSRKNKGFSKINKNSRTKLNVKKLILRSR
jgi:hypothetical protein